MSSRGGCWSSSASRSGSCGASLPSHASSPASLTCSHRLASLLWSQGRQPLPCCCSTAQQSECRVLAWSRSSPQHSWTELHRRYLSSTSRRRPSKPARSPHSAASTATLSSSAANSRRASGAWPRIAAPLLQAATADAHWHWPASACASLYRGLGQAGASLAASSASTAA